MKDKRFSHNHPSGVGFSRGDLLFSALRVNLKELRAVGQHSGYKYLYSLARIGKHWQFKDGKHYNKVEFDTKLTSIYNQLNAEAAKRYTPIVNNNKITPKQAHRLYVAYVVGKLVKHLDVKYIVRRFK